MNLAEARSKIEAALLAFRPANHLERGELALWLADRTKERIGDLPAWARKLIDPSFPGEGPGLRITIDRRVPSQNASTYAHWRDYAAEKQAWAILLRAALKPRLKAPDHLMYLQIVSFRTKELDFANLVGGAKPIPDCLKELRYIHDDSPQWVRIDYFQHIVPRDQERTEIAFFTPTIRQGDPQ